MGSFLASPAFARSQTCTQRKRFSRLRQGGPSWHPGKETASGCARSPRSPTAAPLSPGDSSRQPLAQAAGDGALGWAVEPARLVYRVSAGALPASCLPCLLWMYMKHLGNVWGFIAIWGLSLQPDRVVPPQGARQETGCAGQGAQPNGCPVRAFVGPTTRVWLSHPISSQRVRWGGRPCK